MRLTFSKSNNSGTELILWTNGLVKDTTGSKTGWTTDLKQPKKNHSALKKGHYATLLLNTFIMWLLCNTSVTVDLPNVPNNHIDKNEFIKLCSLSSKHDGFPSFLIGKYSLKL